MPFAEKDAGLGGGRLGDEFIGQALHRAVPPEIARVGDVPGGSVDDVAVGARSGMLDVDRPDGQVFDADRVAAFERVDRVVRADIEEGREERGISVDDRLGPVAQVEGNVFVQEGEMPDVVAVVMGEEDGVDIGLFVGQVGEVELGAAVEPRDLGNDAEFEVAFEAVGGAGLEPFVEVVFAEVERFAEVEVDLGAGGLEEEFVAADFARAAVEGQGSTQAISEEAWFR